MVFGTCVNVLLLGGDVFWVALKQHIPLTSSPGSWWPTDRDPPGSSGASAPGVGWVWRKPGIPLGFVGFQLSFGIFWGGVGESLKNIQRETSIYIYINKFNLGVGNLFGLACNPKGTRLFCIFGGWIQRESNQTTMFLFFGGGSL